MERIHDLYLSCFIASMENSRTKYLYGRIRMRESSRVRYFVWKSVECSTWQHRNDHEHL
jgi:hypothetical protein